MLASRLLTLAYKRNDNVAEWFGVYGEKLDEVVENDAPEKPYDWTLRGHPANEALPENVAWTPLPITGMKNPQEPAIAAFLFKHGDKRRVLLGRLWTYAADARVPEGSKKRARTADNEETKAATPLEDPFVTAYKHVLWLHPVLSDHALQFYNWKQKTLKPTDNLLTVSVDDKTLIIDQDPCKKPERWARELISSKTSAVLSMAGCKNASTASAFFFVANAADFPLEKLLAALKTMASECTMEEVGYDDSAATTHLQALQTGTTETETAIGAAAETLRTFAVDISSLPSAAPERGIMLHQMLCAARDALPPTAVAAWEDAYMRWFAVTLHVLRDMHCISKGIPAVALAAAGIIKRTVGVTSTHPELVTQQAHARPVKLQQDEAVLRHNMQAMRVPLAQLVSHPLACAFLAGVADAENFVSASPSALTSMYTPSYQAVHSANSNEIGWLASRRLAQVTAPKDDVSVDKQGWLHSWLHNVVRGQTWLPAGLWSTGNFHPRKLAYVASNALSHDPMKLEIFHSYAHAIRSALDAQRRSSTFQPWLLRRAAWRERMNYWSRLGWFVMPVQQERGYADAKVTINGQDFVDSPIAVQADQALFGVDILRHARME